jgi:hypothetical protein
VWPLKNTVGTTVATDRLLPVGLDAVHIADDPAVLLSLRIRSGAALAGHLAGRGRPIDLLAVEGVQLVEHIGRKGAPAATAERQNETQNQPDDAQAAPAERHGTTAHAAAILYLRRVQFRSGIETREIDPNTGAHDERSPWLACSGGLWWTHVDPEILLKTGAPNSRKRRPC